MAASISTLWFAKPGQAYLSQDGIRQIKSKLTNDIFHQEMLHTYEQKSFSRERRALAFFLQIKIFDLTLVFPPCLVAVSDHRKPLHLPDDGTAPMTERDRAATQIIKAAENSDPYAQYLAGKLYRDGPLLIPELSL